MGPSARVRQLKFTPTWRVGKTRVILGDPLSHLHPVRTMSSNLLLDPIEELAQVISINAFGLSPSPTTQILLDSSFPITDEDKVRVAEEAVRSGNVGERVRARANVGLLEGDVLEVVLDRRGYTVGSLLATFTKLC